MRRGCVFSTVFMPATSPFSVARMVERSDALMSGAAVIFAIAVPSAVIRSLVAVLAFAWIAASDLPALGAGVEVPSANAGAPATATRATTAAAPISEVVAMRFMVMLPSVSSTCGRSSDSEYSARSRFGRNQPSVRVR